jgi:hypothetical protein
VQGNPGPLVANPGHYVSIRADTNLKLDFKNCDACKRFTNSCSLLALNQGILRKLQGHH